MSSEPLRSAARVEVAPNRRFAWAERPVVVLSIVFVLLYLASGIRDPAQFSSGGVRTTLLLACPLALFGAAQTLCMLTRGIDLSVAMIANLAAYVAAHLSDRGPFVSLASGLAVGVIAGAANGIGVGVFSANALIMTLGMASVLLGVITVGLVGNGFLAGSTKVLEWLREMSSGTLIGPLPTNFLLLAATVTVLVGLLKFTGLGRMIYAAGDNPEACRLAGVRVWQVLLAVYVLSGILAAMTGLVFSGISGSVGPDQTNSYLLMGVAAAVLGGTSIFGGVGGCGGTVVGALIITVLNRILVGINTSEAVRQILFGSIVLLLAWAYARLTGARRGR